MELRCPIVIEVFIFQENWNIDFIWIDVQGAEYEVIDGIGKMINKISYIWIEYGENIYDGAMNRKQTIEMLSNKNFSLISKLSSNDAKGDLVFKNNLVHDIY